ncbi:MAG: metal-sensing transcriptional repressor [Acholeplasmatales bacterium]|nr:metal-sensing transcriptional repressor [Acholeplasmatales bacterium]
MACKSCGTKEVRTKERTEEEKKKLINRINRIQGQLNGIKNMIEDDRYCDDILIQLSAVDKSVKATANLLLDNHMHSCLIEHIENGDYEIIDDLVDLIRRFQ